MKRTLKKYFIPHSGNNYHPAILHTKRAIFYGLVALLIKGMVIGFAVLLPEEAFLEPNVLALQEQRLMQLTNEVRTQQGLSPLTQAPKLHSSADQKALDMASREYFSHVSPEGRNLGYFLNRAGYAYRVAGENLAMGFSDAESVVAAWKKSGPHYANLVDNDYQEFGIGLEPGSYQGQPTVFVVQHFADPTKPDPVPKTNAETKRPLVRTKPKTTLALNQIRGEKIEGPGSQTAVSSNIVFDSNRSAVSWRERGSSTLLKARATIQGDVQSATVTVQDATIALASIGNNVYESELLVERPVSSFFETVISPNISIRDKQGAIVERTINWSEIKLVRKSPLEKYQQAKRMLEPFVNVFRISRWMLLVFFGFFAAALLLNIFVYIRKQHYVVIGQTIVLLLFINWLYWV